MNKNDVILLVDDESQALLAYEHTLASAGYRAVVTCQDSTHALEMIKTHQPTVILLDLVMPNLGGKEILRTLSEQGCASAVIMLTAVDDVEAAVECMKLGAFDYLVKPVRRERLASTIRSAVEHQELRGENVRLSRYLLKPDLEHPEHFSDIITGCHKLYSLFGYIEAIAPSSHPVLVSGETGTGKELIARSIHTASGRPGEFVPVNVAGLEDQLVADTLFGHTKGAFTGAQASREGLVAKADEGTLFLDEIGDLGPESQVKLLRLLQERQYYPLGSDRVRHASARVVVATHQSLKNLVAQGCFRADLFYRLQTHHLEIPPLRERTEDIPILVDHFVAKTTRELDRDALEIPMPLYALLANYGFPGNIRELQSIIVDAVSLSRGTVLDTEAIRQKLGIQNAMEQQTTHAGPNLVQFSGPLPPLREIEPILIREALKRAGGNQTQAARLLDVSRQTLNTRLVKERR